MLENFNKLLRFLGIRNDFSKKLKSRTLYEKCQEISIYRIYTSFIICILFFEPAIYVYDMFNDRNYELFPIICFMLVQPIQYIHALAYFNIESNPFHELYNEIYCTNYDKKCLPNEFKLMAYIYSVSILSILLSMVVLFINLINDDFVNYDIEKYETNIQVVFYIIRVLKWIYGRITLTLNMYIFFYVFCKHLNDIRNIINSITGSKISISTLCKKIIKVRYDLQISINNLQPIYLTATILSSFALGNMIQYKIYSIDLIISCFVLLIMQCIFLIIIYGVAGNRQELLNYIKSVDFASKYILNRHRIKKYCDEDDIEMKEHKLEIMEEREKKEKYTYEIVNDTNKTIDWILLNSLLTEEWSDFGMLGFKFSDGSAVKKAIFITGLIVAFSNWISKGDFF